MNWTQIFVKAPANNGYSSPQMMRRVEEHLAQSFGGVAHLVSTQSGLPIQNDDQTFEVRVLDASLASSIKFLLTQHYGLEVVRVEERA